MRKQSIAEGNPRVSVIRPAGTPTVLYVSALQTESEEDGVCLERMLEPDWSVIANSGVSSALDVLKETALPIVFCDTGLAARTWREMLEGISFLPDPPLLIVTSRLADDRLWAEALNLGAWDVLAKPFDPEEVTRTVGFAWQHWQDRHGIHSGRTAQRKSADGVKRMAATGT